MSGQGAKTLSAAMPSTPLRTW